MTRDFYQSSEPLTKGLIRISSMEYEYNASEERSYLKNEFKHLVKDEGFDVVCISMAISHMEKLAFAGIMHEDGKCSRLNGQIEGVHTMSIFGGDASMCWEDEKYLRLIARHNGYSQSQVEII
ncbi:hypothetical protein D3C87_976670 [compost metagenome]